MQEIVAWGQEHNSSGYDCIVGVSGGKDSTRQALFVRKLGLHPLLVCCCYPPEEATHRGVANLANLISLGFDAITVTPGPLTSKKMMRYTFQTFGNSAVLFNAVPNSCAFFSSLPIMADRLQHATGPLGREPEPVVGDRRGIVRLRRQQDSVT